MSRSSPPPIKLVHIITGLDLGGAEVMLFRLLSHLDRKKFDPTVICLGRDGPIGKKIRSLDIPVFPLGLNPNRPNPFAWFKLLKIIRQIHPDILHTWMYHSDLVGGLAGFFLKVPVVWAIHNATTDPHGTRTRTLLVIRICALLSHLVPAKIISCSEKARQVHLQVGYAAKKFTIIPNGFDLSNYRPDLAAAQSLRLQWQVEPATVLIGMVARYDPLKDHVNFIHAARIYNQTNPQPHFILCGEGLTWENTSIQAEIDAAGLHSHFHLLGRRDDMPSVFSALTLHTLSSISEAFPNVLGEAMACGVPCVATDVGDSSFLIGDTGLIVPPKDPQALADAWERILNLSPEERFTLGERARQRIEHLFRIEQVALQYEDLYEQILEAHRLPGSD
jgi:glycosyltransferase involved in cell wall biosynthesis